MTRWSTWTNRAGAISLMALGACRSCHDSEAHRGQASRGAPADADPSAPKIDQRLVYAPGGPMHAAAVAAVFRKRLAALGIKRDQVKIGGTVVDVDVAADQVAAVGEALAGGRLDLFILSDKRDPLGAAAADLPAGITLRAITTGGGRPQHFAVAAPDARSQLMAYLEKQSTGARPLVGPLHEGQHGALLLRSYYVMADESARGERLTRARARRDESGVRLDLTFGGAGKSFVAWRTRQPTTFAVYVDGAVLATSHEAKPISDGRLSFGWPSRGPAAADESARALGLALDGVALSHEVKQLETRPL